MNLMQKLEEFKSLDVNEKKKKLIAIFEYAKDNIDFSKTALDYLTSNEQPDELVMWNLYELIVNAMVFAKDRIQWEYEEKQGKSSHDLSEKSLASQKSDQDEADKLLDLINFI